MSALTMEQRRADFEAMLKRADQVRATVGQCWTTEEDVPGKPLAALARDTAELCTAWVDAAQRTKEGRPPSDQVASRAILVAARCLQALAEQDPDGYLEGAEREGTFGFDHDRRMTPGERVGWLLNTLGDIASCYHQGFDPCGVVMVHRLRVLTIEAICAAVAADNGRWEAEA